MSNTITLKGDGIHKEAVAGGSVTPGMLLARTSAGTVVAHNVAGGNALPAFATEDELQGKDITDAYASGDKVLYTVFERGAEVNALVAAHAAAISEGDFLDSDGAGGLRKSTAQTQPAEDGIYQDAALAVSATAEKFKTTQTLYWRRNAIQFSKTATDNLTFSSAYTINTGAAAGIKYGAFLIQINDAGTTSTKAVSADQVYTSAALALAAVPATDTGNTAIGTIVIGAKTGASWTANTDDMTAASDCESVAVADADTLTVVPTSIVQNGVVAIATEAVDNSAVATAARIKVEVL